MKKQIRVALSGGGFRFASHIGALAAIEEAGYEVIELAATSGGAIVAAMYAKGITIEQLKHIALTTNFEPMLSFNFDALLNFSFCNGNKLRTFLESIIGVNTEFWQLRVPLRVVASDIAISKSFIFDKADDCVIQAIMASAAVPFLYSPVKINKQWLVDGGVTSNLPIELLTNDGVLKLGIKLSSRIDTTPIDSMFDIIGRTANLLFESNTNKNVDIGTMNKALFSMVDTGTIGSFDTKISRQTREALFDRGYNATKLALETFAKFTNGKRTLINYADINQHIYGLEQ